MSSPRFSIHLSHERCKRIFLDKLDDFGFVFPRIDWVDIHKASGIYTWEFSETVFKCVALRRTRLALCEKESNLVEWKIRPPADWSSPQSLSIIQALRFF